MCVVTIKIAAGVSSFVYICAIYCIKFRIEYQIEILIHVGARTLLLGSPRPDHHTDTRVETGRKGLEVLRVTMTASQNMNSLTECGEGVDHAGCDVPEDSMADLAVYTPKGKGGAMVWVQKLFLDDDEDKPRLHYVQSSSIYSNPSLNEGKGR